MFWMAKQVPNHGVQNHGGGDRVLNQEGSNADDGGFFDELPSLRLAITTRILDMLRFQLQALLLDDQRRCRRILPMFPLPLEETRTEVILNGDDYGAAFCGVFELEDSRVLPLRAEKLSSLGYRRTGSDHRQDFRQVFKNWFLDYTTIHNHKNNLKFREARNDEQDSLDKSDCWVMPKLSKSSYVNGNRLLGKQISMKQLSLDLLSEFGQSKQNYYSSPPTGSSLYKKLNIFQPNVKYSSMYLMEAAKCDDKVISKLLNYSIDCKPNMNKETMPKDPIFYLDDNTFNQNKRKETAQSVSFSIILAILCLSFLFATCSQTMLQKYLAATMINFQPLHKEHGPVSKFVPLLGLFGFMMFVWSVATMILAGAKLTRVHTAMFIFCAISMHVMSDNSVNVMDLPILGVFLMGWYGKATMKAQKFSSTSVMLDPVMPLL